MRWKTVINFIAGSLLWSTGLSAAIDFDPGEADTRALKQYVEELRAQKLNEKLNYLSISGDVRLTWKHFTVFRDGINKTGSDEQKQRPPQDWLAETALLIDVGRLPAWSQAKISFQNSLGQRSGTLNKFSLKRALLGYDFADGSCREIYVQAGREMLSDDFDSKIQFNVVFDGAMVSWTERTQDIGTYYLKGGPMVIDFARNQYGWVGETGMEDIADTGAFMKVSAIHWKKNFRHNAPGSNNYRFVPVQYLVGYWFEPEYCYGAPLELYAAYLQNYAAKPINLTLCRRENKAWYAGFTYGSLKQAGDWVVDLNYQWVQALAIPQFDVSGIGTGFVTDDYPDSGEVMAYPEDKNDSANDKQLKKEEDKRREGVNRFFLADAPAYARGDTNYRGWAFKAGMRLTDNLVGTATMEWSRPIISQIGGRGHYRKAQIQMALLY